MLGFRAGAGGIGRVMVTLMRGLLRRGVEIDLLLPAGDYPDLDEVAGAVSIHPLETGSPERARSQLRAYLADRRPRALLSNRDLTHALLAAHDWGAHGGAHDGGAHDGKTDRPRIGLRIGTDVPEKLRRQNPLSAPLKRRQLARLYQAADVLIAISPGVGDALRGMLRGRPGPEIRTIWNPVDAERVRRAAQQPVVHRWLSDRPGPLIVSVGRLVRAKNYTLLLRALARIAEPLDARLIICGEGNQRRRLETLAERLGIAGRVDLPGHVANPFPLMAAADLFVVSSLFEGGNNALMEAMTLGIRCVSTDCRSGPGDVLAGGALGPLVPVGDDRALADAMRRGLSDPVDRAALLAGAERFDLDDSARAYALALGLSGRDGGR